MRIVIVDANYICYRALYTTGGLSYKNKKTGIVYGFLTQLLTIAKAVKMDNIVFAWDSRQSKRREIYSDYKNRRSRPLSTEELKDMKENFRQFAELRTDILPDIGFENNFKFTGFEADDIIAQIVMSERYKNHKFVVVTEDDDLLQLLNHCVIYHPMRNQWRDAEWMKKEHGIGPEDWVRVKQIAGCVSDNVQGVFGVGKKKAIQYITGTMKPSLKIYRKIQSEENQYIINRNEALVRLPFYGTPEAELHEGKTQLNMKNLRRICKELGIRTLISPDREDEWSVYFNG